MYIVTSIVGGYSFAILARGSNPGEVRKWIDKNYPECRVPGFQITSLMTLDQAKEFLND